MGFNTHINDRLNQWARWLLSQASGGLGYPSQCAFARMSADGDSYSSRVPVGISEAAWEVEQAVQSLAPELRQCVVAIYCESGTMEQKAKDYGCHRVTLYARLDRAHEQIMDWLQMYACETRLTRLHNICSNPQNSIGVTTRNP